METIDILKQCIVDGLIVRLPDIQLDRKQYLNVAGKLQLIGGKWKGGKTKGFVFETDPTDLLNDIANGENRDLKKEFQFFSTPPDVADLMIQKLTLFLDKADLKVSAKILEPSAGDGALIKAFINQGWYTEGLVIDCFELMELNRKKLSKISSANIIGEDFLKALSSDGNNQIRGQYDIVIANPPFNKNQDIDHIRAMYDCLKPGGQLVTLASPSWTFGSQRKQIEFREWLKKVGADIEEIEEGAFKKSGTNIRCMMIKVIKQQEFLTINNDDMSKDKKTETEFPLLPYKGYPIVDGGQVPGGDPGDCRIIIKNEAGEILHQSIFYNSTDPTSINKGIIKAKEWIDANLINEAAKEPVADSPRYPDNDLAFFKGIIEKKLEAAQKELVYLEGLIKKKDDPDKQPDEPDDMEIGQLTQMAERQKVFIDHLEKAMERIHNKTYGICRVTGKLIDKARLTAVPHATLSMEAKNMIGTKEGKEIKKEEPPKKSGKKKSGNKDKAEEGTMAALPTLIMQNYKGFGVYDDAHPGKKEMRRFLISVSPFNDHSQAAHILEYIPVENHLTTIDMDHAKDWIDSLRRCRVCGCTQYDCRQCIEKTGSACHWVEQDLCSACVPEKPVEVIDNRSSAEQVINSTNENNTSMSFFQQLVVAVPKGLDATIRILEKDGQLTVGLFPSVKSKMKPVNMVGTAAELDEGFFKAIVPEIKEISGILTNVEQVKKEPSAVKKEEKKTSSSSSTKSGQKKKAPAKKKATKKPVIKKSAPKPKPAVKAGTKPKKSVDKKQETPKPVQTPAPEPEKEIPRVEEQGLF